MDDTHGVIVVDKPIRFRANEDFFSPELQSQYCKDLEYTWMPGYDILGGLMPGWIADGKITVVKIGDEVVSGALSAGEAQVTGQGTVT
jgi:hypothetical protein